MDCFFDFPFQFLPDNPKTDPRILDKLTTDENLSGFLNWALKGLQQLLKNKKFSYSKTTDETRQHYMKLSDSEKAFIEECIDHNPQRTVPKNALYYLYKRWCVKENVTQVSKQPFTKKVVQLVPEIRETRIKIEGKMLRCCFSSSPN